MKRNKRIVIGCSIVAAIGFGIVSYGHFTGAGWGLAGPLPF